MAELLLDSKIRFWVFLPIMAITFLVGIIKHYLFLFMSNDKTVEKQQLVDSQALLRSRLVRENGKYIPRESFLMRKNYFVNEETGFLVKQKRAPKQQMPMNGKNLFVFIFPFFIFKNFCQLFFVFFLDPKVMADMLKGNFLNMIPMVVIGGWINWAYAGFLCSTEFYFYIRK